MKLAGDEKGVGVENEGFKPTLPGSREVMGEDGVEEKFEGVEVVPEPGLVLKTVDTSSKKVFINICQSPLIPASAPKTKLMVKFS